MPGIVRSIQENVHRPHPRPLNPILGPASGSFIITWILSPRTAVEVYKWCVKAGIYPAVPIHHLHCSIYFCAESARHWPRIMNALAPPVEIDGPFWFERLGPRRVLVLRLTARQCRRAGGACAH